MSFSASGSRVAARAKIPLVFFRALLPCNLAVRRINSSNVGRIAECKTTPPASPQGTSLGVGCRQLTEFREHAIDLVFRSQLIGQKRERPRDCRNLRSLGVLVYEARRCVHSIPDLSLLLPELNRGSSVPRYRLGSPLPSRSTLREGRKPTLNRARGRNDCKHNHLRSLPAKARLAHFSRQSQRRGYYPGVVRPAQA